MVGADTRFLRGFPEPYRDVRDESHFNAELGGDFALMDVVRQAVGDQVVCEVLYVVLGARLCTSS